MPAVARPPWLGHRPGRKGGREGGAAPQSPSTSARSARATPPAKDFLGACARGVPGPRARRNLVPRCSCVRRRLPPAPRCVRGPRRRRGGSSSSSVRFLSLLGAARCGAGTGLGLFGPESECRANAGRSGQRSGQTPDAGRPAPGVAKTPGNVPKTPDQTPNVGRPASDSGPKCLWRTGGEGGADGPPREGGAEGTASGVSRETCGPEDLALPRTPCPARSRAGAAGRPAGWWCTRGGGEPERRGRPGCRQGARPERAAGGLPPPPSLRDEPDAAEADA